MIGVPGSVYDDVNAGTIIITLTAAIYHRITTLIHYSKTFFL